MTHYTVHHLSSDRTAPFDRSIEPDFAVALAQATDDGKTVVLMEMFHAGDDWRREFNVIEGERTVACGDWCALREGV